MPFLSSQQLDDEPQWERIESFAGGEDSFRRSTLIDPDQSQKLVNVIVRDNFEARTRPGADPLSGGQIDTGVTRGLFYFDTPTIEQLLIAVAGKLYKVESGGTKTQLAWSPVDAGTRVVIAQGVDKALISDGHGDVQIYDGTSFTDCVDAPTNPPKGATILCWHAGRMFAAGFNEEDAARTRDAIFVSNRLDFGVGQWNNVQRQFRVGAGDGDPIVGLASMQDFTLCVLKENSVWLVSTDPTNEPANYATDQTTAALSKGFGCVGRDAWCAYQNDILFMAQDGVRSVQRMQAAAGQWQLSAPISQPIQPYIDRINRSFWNVICAKKYQEFAFFFVPLDNSQVNNCVLVWNGRLGKWLGAWTGDRWNGQAVEITRFAGVNRLVFGDDQGYVSQWKDFASLTDDATYLDNGAGYPTTVWTRSFLFGEAVNNKSAYSTILRFAAGNANINLTWCQDTADVRAWSAAASPSGDILGTGTLPFQLEALKPLNVKRGLRSTVAFNEAFLKIETQSGWFDLRNVSVGAYVNPLLMT